MQKERLRATSERGFLAHGAKVEQRHVISAASGGSRPILDNR